MNVMKHRWRVSLPQEASTRSLNSKNLAGPPAPGSRWFSIKNPTRSVETPRPVDGSWEEPALRLARFLSLIIRMASLPWTLRGLRVAFGTGLWVGLICGLMGCQGSEPPVELDSGLHYKNDRSRTVPWSIHVLTIDLSRPDIEIIPALGSDQTFGLRVLSQQVLGIPNEWGQPRAAINGDFYHLEHEAYPGDPDGLLIIRGELISAPHRKDCFWMDAERRPHLGKPATMFRVTWPTGELIPFGLNELRRVNSAVLYTWRVGPTTRTSGGREIILERSGENPWLPLKVGQKYTARVREVRPAGNSRLNTNILVLSLGPALANRLPVPETGSELALSTATVPDLTGAIAGLGGGPILLQDGKPQNTDSHKGNEIHPRSAIGWSSNTFFFVTVDGRQSISRGMDLDELSAYMARQGCTHAMNLDGGASSEMLIEGKVVNRPCAGRERRTANSLVVVRKKP